MFGIGRNPANWVEELQFVEPNTKAQELFNELLRVVEDMEKSESKWEKIIESEEGAQINMVKIETLDTQMEEKHKKFEKELKKFEEATKSQTEVEENLQAILKTVEDIRSSSAMLDNVNEKANRELEKGNDGAVEMLEEAIEEERKNTRQDLTSLRKKLEN
jgi:hypothetical protein